MQTEACPVCGEDIPDGKFCAFCGARLSAGGAADRLRLDAYAVAPRQRVLRPWVTTTLFPQLPPPSRRVFRVGLIVVTGAAALFALLGWQGPVLTTCVLGLPILFAVYLHEIGFRRALPGRYFALALAVAVGTGFVWARIAGPVVAEAYLDEMGGRLGLGQLLLCGVAIPATYAFVLVAPAAVVRVLHRARGEALDGFTVGAVGATVANAAATATLLAPQVVMGEDQPVDTLLAEVLVEGVAWPLGSVAAGGVFGLALWFIPRAGVPQRYRRTVVVWASFFGALAFSIIMGVVDVAPIPVSVYLALQLLIALGAVLATRVVITDALLHEASDDDADGQLRCSECDHVVASKGFCTECGVAIRARSQTSREERRVRPAGFAEAAGAGKRGAGYVKVLGPVVGGVGLAAAATIMVATFVKPAPAAYACPPDCGRPPVGNPVETNPRYSGDDGAFSVAYPGEGTAYEITFDPPGMNGVRAKYISGDTGMLNLFGEPAQGRTAEQIAAAVLESKFPGASVAYEIPNASVGYEPGYGVVADVYPRDTSSTYNRLRVIVMAAVRHDYALIATAAGPYHEFSPDYGTGHPSGANLEVAMDMGKYVNSFRWFGDRRKRPQ